MAFRKYKSLEQVKQIFPYLEVTLADFVPTQLPAYPIPVYLEQQLKENLGMPRTNEYFVCEFLIVPILREVWLQHKKHLKLWTHPTLTYKKELTGNPDYLISYSQSGEYLLLGPPIVSVVEAKFERFNQGWAQCLVEMITCQKLNENPDITVFGIVSTGTEWQMGRLHHNRFEQQSSSYSVANLPQLMSVLEYVLSFSEKQFMV